MRVQLRRSLTSLSLCFLLTLVLVGPIQAHDINLNFNYFKDDGSAIAVPGADVNLELWQGGEISASVSADTVSHASEYQVSEADTVTSASELEHRLLMTLGLQQTWQQWKFSVSGYNSTEPDYISRALSFTIARDFFQRNTNLSFHGFWGNDDISSNEDPDLAETSQRLGGTLSWTQVLSSTRIARVNFSYSQVDGYQANPYRYALRSASAPAFDNRECLPHERNRFAIYTRLNMYQKNLRAALHPSYRYYWDDWGIESHELGLRFYKYLLADIVSHLDLRFYSQSQADHYQEVWNEPAEYMTSHAKFAAGQTWLVALGSRYDIDIERSGRAWEIINDLSISGGLGYYYHQAHERNALIGYLGLGWFW